MFPICSRAQLCHPLSLLELLIPITPTTLWGPVRNVSLLLCSLCRSVTRSWWDYFSLIGLWAESDGKVLFLTRVCSVQISVLSTYLWSQFLAMVCSFLFNMVEGNTNPGGKGNFKTHIWPQSHDINIKMKLLLNIWKGLLTHTDTELVQQPISMNNSA